MVTIATWLAGLVAIGIILIGIRFLLQPVASAEGYGVPVSMNAYLTVKGVRDITAGLVVLPALLTGNQHMLGWLILASVFAPLGDMVVVLRNGGPRAVAFGVHGLTAAVMAVVAAILILV
ncbi:DUF4267 domain-containing protein [Planomonospora venezuelensis]|uniref:DUF4267 domain-containing protein n=1 Tax=Planomonospora venezuelensis TaxID=1999 RepID=A0A841DIA4_PLAVE|nr:DUF4267 domain-containing protein [Planomonospora venezuelensis]MBB5966896.1 hypothetical protein [Planomonospora venezuelensis]GIN02397.1 membrane protein [Planomonospora venezuelensis]